MIVPIEVKKDILVTLISAEKTGNPIKLKLAKELWGRGSVWESLVDSRYIIRCTNSVTVTVSGHEWLKEYFPDISVDTIPVVNVDDLASCERDHMTKGQKIALII